LVGAGLIYFLTGVFSGHFHRHVLPRTAELRPALFWAEVVTHARMKIQAATGGPQYGLLQKCAYFGVVFLALPEQC